MQPRNPSRSEAALWRLGLFVSFSVLLASVVPAGVELAVFATMLKTGAFVALAFAAIVGDNPFAAYLTRWDEAALLMLVGVVAGLFVDPDAVAEAIAHRN